MNSHFTKRPESRVFLQPKNKKVMPYFQNYFNVAVIHENETEHEIKKQTNLKESTK